MTKQEIELETRQAYLLYETSIVEDPRILTQSDRSLYIEATLPRIPDQNLEVMLFRLYFP